ncbi:MAG: hypothetical protein L6Q49_20715 [Anaerolineales bacterium]|nr:hypothetical protein [Anaerolineales bacterium]
MNKSKKLNRDYEAIAWGLLVIWWGLRWSLLASLPNGIGLLGTGVILLGLNAIRSFSRIPARDTTSVLGFLALAVGGMLLAGEILNMPFEIPVFEILLIAFGVLLLVRAFRKPETRIECC